MKCLFLWIISLNTPSFHRSLGILFPSFVINNDFDICAYFGLKYLNVVYKNIVNVHGDHGDNHDPAGSH